MLDFAHRVPARPQFGYRRRDFRYDQSVAQDVLQVLRRVRRENFPFVHDEHTIAGHFHFEKSVRRDEHGVVAPQVFDELAHGADLVRVQADRRLVQNDKLGLVDERIGEADTLAIAFRQITDDFTADVRQRALLHHNFDPFAALANPQAFQPGSKLEIFAHSHVEVQRIVFRHVTNPAAHLVGLGEHVEARHPRGAVRGRQVARQDAHGGALPGAIRAEETDNLTPLHGEVDAVHRRVASITLGQILDLNDQAVTHGYKSLRQTRAVEP